MRKWKKCTDDRGYTLIELAAVLAITALAAMVIGSLILTGMRRSEQMRELQFREELLLRIREQLVDVLTYCEDLSITGASDGRMDEDGGGRQMHGQVQTLIIDRDGFISLNGSEIFGASHFGEYRLGCQVEIEEQSLTLELWLMQNGDEVGRAQDFVRLYNMELLKRGIKAASERYDNREGEIIFDIGVSPEEDV